MELRLPLEMSPGREAACRAVFDTGVGSHSLLQGIFQTQELNLGLLHCRWILYHLSHQGSLSLLDNFSTIVFLHFFSGYATSHSGQDLSSLTRNQTWALEVKALSLNHRTARELPWQCLKFNMFI